MMERYLSKNKLESFVGDVLPLRLLGGTPYTMDAITWKLDGDCVLLRSFEKDEKYPFTDGVLLTFVKPGKATVTATLEGTDYVCEISAREAKTAKPGDELNYYIGDFHDHTYNKHKYDLFIERTEVDYPRKAIRKVRDENMLDFTVVTDHACLLNGQQFFLGFADTEDAQPMDLVVFPGSESEVTLIEYDRYGVKHKNAGECNTVNCTGWASVRSWDAFFEKLEGSPFAICKFNHPQTPSFSTPGIWGFRLDTINQQRFLDRFRLIATGDGTDRSGHLVHEYAYSIALDAGFKISPTSSSDSHGQVWGYFAAPGKTVIMAPEKSKEAFLDAIRNNRVYATGSGNVKLYYEVNGIAAPATLPETDTYEFKVKIDYFHYNPQTEVTKMLVVSDRGEYVETIDCTGKSEVTFTIHSDTARYFYLRLIDRKKNKTFSCPIWTGRAPIPAPTQPLQPLDKKGFTAVDIESGEDASVVLSDDPYKHFRSKGVTSTIVIDMQSEQTISALSHYPRLVSAHELRDEGQIAPWYLCELPRHFRLSTSVDGEEYTVQKEGGFRDFAYEEFVRFPETKARYVKLEVLTTVGLDSERKDFKLSHVAINELTIWKNA